MFRHHLEEVIFDEDDDANGTIRRNFERNQNVPKFPRKRDVTGNGAHPKHTSIVIIMRETLKVNVL